MKNKSRKIKQGNGKADRITNLLVVRTDLSVSLHAAGKKLFYSQPVAL